MCLKTSNVHSVLAKNNCGDNQLRCLDIMWVFFVVGSAVCHRY